MRKVEDVLRLKWEAGLSVRQIAKAVGIGRTTVSEYIARAEAAGIGWPLPEGMDGAALERRLFNAPEGGGQGKSGRVLPDFATTHRELRGKGMTLFLLWQEYRKCHVEGYGYSQFCEHYGRWKGRVDVVMRQSHRAGEKLFVDDAAQTVAVVDRTTGEIRQAQIFVAVLGASNDTFAEATWSQGLADWIGSQERALAFLGGVPQLIIPDNLKSAVSKAHRYEPDLNPIYQDFATHYGVAVIPARVRKLRGKEPVESGVGYVKKNWLMGRSMWNRVRRYPGNAGVPLAFSRIPSSRNAAWDLALHTIGPMSQKISSMVWRSPISAP